MKSIYSLLLLALSAGAVLPLQAVLNARMSKALIDPIYAAFISFIIGSIGLLFYALIQKTDLTQITQTGNLAWYVWTAGLLGAFYVVAVILLVPKMGAALTFGLIIAGQLTCSLAFDHFGFLGLPIHLFNWQRLLGILLIIGGVLLIRTY